MARPDAPDRVNLARSTVLLVDHNQKSLDMLSSIFHGFGVKQQIKRGSTAEAVEVVETRDVDLILIDCSMPGMDGYDFTRWLRRETPAPVRYTPVIMLTGHAAQSKVHKGRDCGASFVVTKPLTPSVLLQRILWLAGDEREFVECDTYIGPDRRVRNFGPPMGLTGRRQGDLSAHVGEASEANMDQSDIDMMMKPMRVSL
ncbi:response regulator [Brevundimonas sp.]|uniref:response regulator n=1 Tax=Brevundimonas sp. TaxID=1871086 RepID=UPI003BACC368